MEKLRILFVCLGNICRSPSAEAILKKLILNENLQTRIYIDSAGTSDYHLGEFSDARMIEHAVKRNIQLDHTARQFDPAEDFERFDFIIAMDNENYSELLNLDYRKLYSNKIYKFVEFCSNYEIEYVPDPYFGGAAGFEFVLDILEDGCKGILRRIKDELE